MTESEVAPGVAVWAGVRRVTEWLGEAIMPVAPSPCRLHREHRFHKAHHSEEFMQ